MFMIERPDYMNKILPFIDMNVIKVFTGIRRCGKSTILSMFKKFLLEKRGILSQNIIEVNFESKKMEFNQSVEKTYEFIKQQSQDLSGKFYLLFDEIQELDGWEKLINTLTIDFDVDIYLTGSNAKLLSSELSTYLGGRYIEIQVFPFSFKEIHQLLLQRNSTLQDSFMEYVSLGGMPFIYETGITGEAVRIYLQDVFNSVMLKDISQRHKIREIDLLERFIMFLLSETGHLFSAKSIIKYMKSQKRSISLETIYNFLKYSAEACISLPLKRYNLVGKEFLSTMEKIYVADHGFREAIIGGNGLAIDQILENIVAVELLRRGWKLSVGLMDNKEIDFVAQRKSDILYIQVSYLMPTEETRQREFAPLEAISDNYPKTVLSLDLANFSHNGIVHRNLIDFLLE